MAFFEAEFPRAIEFEQDGGPAFNTYVFTTQSGQDTTNRNWAGTRGEYTASVVAAEDPTGTSAAFAEAVRAFFMLLGGKADPFRYFDPIDNSAGSYAGKPSEPMVVVPGTSNLQWQLTKTYSLGGRTYQRAITKPIGPGVVDYLNKAFAESVVVHQTGGTVSSIDHTTGIVIFSVAPSGTPTADFQYHIPVKLTTDKFAPRVVRSGKGNRITRWNFGLIIGNPPNY
jgi:uncharacterized protein (TIGR02217 family)